MDEVSVFTLQDAYASPVEPTEAMTFSLYGVTSFEVQYWTGSGWATVQGGSVSANNKVWRKLTFPAVVTTKIRVHVTGALDGSSRIAEVEAWGPTGAGGGGEVKWLVSDHLGTPRMVVDESGALAGENGVRRHDYLPFGEEIGAGVGGRAPAQGYGQVDNVRQKFTGHERDEETALYYMKARYFSSMMGRFTSPDSTLLDQWQGNPQSWNLYSYVRNNPFRLVDPTGNAAQEAQDQKCSDAKDGRCGPFHKENYIDEEGGDVVVTNVRDKDAAGGGAGSNPAAGPNFSLLATYPCNKLRIHCAFIDTFPGPGGGGMAVKGAGQAARAGGRSGSGFLARWIRWVLGPAARLPKGFHSMSHLRSTIIRIRRAGGADDAIVGVRGSAATGLSHDGTRVFDDLSDIDFLVISDTLFEQGVAAGARPANGALRVSATMNFFPELHAVEKALSSEFGRKTTIRIFSSAGYEAVKAGTDIIGP